MSDRTPFRVVVREVVNLFEDNSSASAGDENHDHHGDTFEMTARSRETSPRTIIGDPDTEFQGKQELQDGERFFQKPQNEDDLFDDSFQAPPTPCSSSTKSKTLPSLAPVKNTEEDDDIFNNIDTQDFHIPSKTVHQGETTVKQEIRPDGGNKQEHLVCTSAISKTLSKEKVASNVEDLSDFKTAGGKAMYISATTLSAVKGILKDETDDGLNDKQNSTEASSGSVPVSRSRISAETLRASSKYQLDAIENSADRRHSFKLHTNSKISQVFTEDLPRQSHDGKKSVFVKSTFEGFKTANGESVPVSAKHLELVRAMFEKELAQVPVPDHALELSDRKDEVTSLAGDQANKLHEIPAIPIGFVSAKGSALKVSANALEGARRMFREESLEINIQNGDVKANEIFEPATSGTRDFFRATGKNVTASEKHLKTARNILEKEPVSSKPSVSAAAKSLVPTTPSEKHVSDATVERSMRLLSDIDTKEPKSTAGVNKSKTPVRRVSGLKRRSAAICPTASNEPSSFTTPQISTWIGTSLESTPEPVVRGDDFCQSKSYQDSKGQGLPLIDSCVTASTSDGMSSKSSVKNALRELMLIDRAPAYAGADWFQDDESGKKIDLNVSKKMFLQTLNVSSKNDFDLWFANHFEQVVWKLSAYSRRIRELTGCLTVHNVLEQLRKRWKLEVQGTHRSPLKMIVERDESSERTMVLLVKQISPELVLSDGWYSIPCDIDPPLATVLSRAGSRSGIAVGHKLCVSGAALRGARDGVDPLHLEGARLAIHYNSTRRARWHARLGFCRETLAVPLLSAQPNGGSLPLIRVRVTSCSSLMYFEKFAQGGSIIRKESDEVKERRKFEGEIAKIQEKVREQVRKEIEAEKWHSKRVLRPRNKENVSKLNSGEEIYEAIEASHDPSQVMMALSSSQKRMLERYHDCVQANQCARIEEAVRRKMEELRQREECPLERKVASLLKLFVRCVSSEVEVPLTIWRPSEELRALLSRPHVIIAILRANVTSCRNFPLGLTTTQSTRFHCLTKEPLPTKNDSNQKREKRTSVSLTRDVSSPSKRPRLHLKSHS
ncbi:breast cancer type 2 susceptibility protein homolog isoform X1 [Varroa destructor]|uniref:BRCA2 OB1 domain-containing protein n=1 Tax=Varroa destructor TaxID=109461 RepID=A0A7M7J5U9_VARDE|nr:breast cancer type 2 susceptibility protein homolog isoform X1 [Varroa destructor]XP_022643470.1 breast cancer type 2 susceptibility protein homolog isoform X1 [Varroa destructor]